MTACCVYQRIYFRIRTHSTGGGRDDTRPYYYCIELSLSGLVLLLLKVGEEGRNGKEKDVVEKDVRRESWSLRSFLHVNTCSCWLWYGSVEG